MTLNECRNELSSIINELRSIEAGIRTSFKYIGEQEYGNCVGKIADKYDWVLRRLRNVDYNRLAEWIFGNN